jgi:hypothetical protein
MAASRAELHRESASDRRPSAAMRAAPVAAPQGAARVLQQRLGNAGMQTLLRARFDSDRKVTLQRRATGEAQSGTIPPIVHEVLRSPGQPLDRATRAFMEPRFGQALSGVRVHTDAKAAESARAVNALAYTVGPNIVFGAGRHAPATDEGNRLMAHELTHVRQQRNITVGPLTFGPSETRYEQEAENVSNALSSSLIERQPAAGTLTDHPAPLIKASTLTSPLVQRQRAPNEAVVTITGEPSGPPERIGPDVIRSRWITEPEYDRQKADEERFEGYSTKTNGNHVYVKILTKYGSYLYYEVVRRAKPANEGKSASKIIGDPKTSVDKAAANPAAEKAEGLDAIGRNEFRPKERTREFLGQHDRSQYFETEQGSGNYNAAVASGGFLAGGFELHKIIDIGNKVGTIGAYYFIKSTDMQTFPFIQGTLQVPRAPVVPPRDTTLARNLNFVPRQAGLQGPADTAVLNAIARLMRNRGFTTVSISFRTDVYRTAYSTNLFQARMNTIRGVLMNSGIPPIMIYYNSDQNQFNQASATMPNGANQTLLTLQSTSMR